MCGTASAAVETGLDGHSEPVTSPFAQFDTSRLLTLKDFVSGYPVHISTAVLRKSMLDLPHDFISVPNGDVAIFAFQAKSGPVAYLPDITSTYRLHDHGIWSGTSRIQRLKGFQQTVDILIRAFNGAHAKELRRWEYADACLVKDALYDEGKPLQALLFQVKSFPRYARHITVGRPLTKAPYALREWIRRSISRLRVKAGLRTRFRRWFSQ